MHLVLCSTGCGFALQQWVEEMSLYMKAIDPNHLVTIGEEGFYSTTCDRSALSPVLLPQPKVLLYIPSYKASSRAMSGRARYVISQASAILPLYRLFCPNACSAVLVYVSTCLH